MSIIDFSSMKTMIARLSINILSRIKLKSFLFLELDFSFYLAKSKRILTKNFFEMHLSSEIFLFDGQSWIVILLILCSRHDGWRQQKFNDSYSSRQLRSWSWRFSSWRIQPTTTALYARPLYAARRRYVSANDFDWSTCIYNLYKITLLSGIFFF